MWGKCRPSGDIYSTSRRGSISSAIQRSDSVRNSLIQSHQQPEEQELQVGLGNLGLNLNDSQILSLKRLSGDAVLHSLVQLGNTIIPQAKGHQETSSGFVEVTKESPFNFQKTRNTRRKTFSRRNSSTAVDILLDKENEQRRTQEWNHVEPSRQSQRRHSTTTKKGSSDDAPYATSTGEELGYLESHCERKLLSQMRRRQDVYRSLAEKFGRDISRLDEVLTKNGCLRNDDGLRDALNTAGVRLNHEDFQGFTADVAGSKERLLRKVAAYAKNKLPDSHNPVPMSDLQRRKHSLLRRVLHKVKSVEYQHKHRSLEASPSNDITQEVLDGSEDLNSEIEQKDAAEYPNSTRLTIERNTSSGNCSNEEEPWPSQVDNEINCTSVSTCTHDLVSNTTNRPEEEQAKSMTVGSSQETRKQLILNKLETHYGVILGREDKSNLRELLKETNQIEETLGKQKQRQENHHRKLQSQLCEVAMRRCKHGSNGLRSLFLSLDESRSGRVPMKEMHRKLKQYGFSVSLGQLQELMGREAYVDYSTLATALFPDDLPRSEFLCHDYRTNEPLVRRREKPIGCVNESKWRYNNQMQATFQTATATKLQREKKTVKKQQGGESKEVLLDTSSIQAVQDILSVVKGRFPNGTRKQFLKLVRNKASNFQYPMLSRQQLKQGLESLTGSKVKESVMKQLFQVAGVDESSLVDYSAFTRMLRPCISNWNRPSFTLVNSSLYECLRKSNTAHRFEMLTKAAKESLRQKQVSQVDHVGPLLKPEEDVLGGTTPVGSINKSEMDSAHVFGEKNRRRKSVQYSAAFKGEAMERRLSDTMPSPVACEYVQLTKGKRRCSSDVTASTLSTGRRVSVLLGGKEEGLTSSEVSETCTPAAGMRSDSMEVPTFRPIQDSASEQRNKMYHGDSIFNGLQYPGC